MQKPVIDETKLSAVMQIIEEAAELMAKKDCEDDIDARDRLEKLQQDLRNITENEKIVIKDYQRYWSATDLETVARGALMPQSINDNLSREELIDLVEMIISIRDKATNRILTEAEHHALVLKFKKNINHPGGSDLIFYPELVGLPPEPTVEQIVDLAMKGI